MSVFVSVFKCRLCGAEDPYIFMWEKQWVKRSNLTFLFVDGVPEVDDWGLSDEVSEIEDAGAEQEWWCGEWHESTPTLAELIEEAGK